MIEKITAYSVSLLADVLDELQCGGILRSFEPLLPGIQIAGFLRTVSFKKEASIDVMSQRHFDLKEAHYENEILLVDAGGELSVAFWDQRMQNELCKKNYKGVLVHGAIRDAQSLRAARSSVFLQGHSPRSCRTAWSMTTWDTPAFVEGLVLLSGDLVVGDCDGILLIPRGDVMAVLSRAKEIQKERRMERDSDYFSLKGQSPVSLHRI